MDDSGSHGAENEKWELLGDLTESRYHRNIARLRACRSEGVLVKIADGGQRRRVVALQRMNSSTELRGFYPYRAAGHCLLRVALRPGISTTIPRRRLSRSDRPGRGSTRATACEQPAVIR
ncbi:hypothetical protein [Nocardia amamiensis]|uniref:hypothetical protein n=1 Tax=Nocardia amamiensis TaxID=404578 RepID=UPI00082CB38B|nr:hypothetical protein [Nocardia amamiensis]